MRPLKARERKYAIDDIKLNKYKKSKRKALNRSPTSQDENPGLSRRPAQRQRYNESLHTSAGSSESQDSDVPRDCNLNRSSVGEYQESGDDGALEDDRTINKYSTSKPHRRKSQESIIWIEDEEIMEGDDDSFVEEDNQDGDGDVDVPNYKSSQTRDKLSPGKNKGKGKAPAQGSPQNRKRKGKSNSKETPISQAQVDFSSDSEISSDDFDSDPVAEEPENEEGFVYNILYDRYWSPSDEIKLRRSWSQDDLYFSKKADTAEISLWRKSIEIFGEFPPYILPRSVRVATDRKRNANIQNPKTKTTIRDKSWSHDFCEVLGMIMCLPAFRNKDYFLKYVLHRALQLRVNNVERVPHTKAIFSWSARTPNYIEDILERVRKELSPGLSSKQMEQLSRIVFEEREPPEHFDFHLYLDRTVTVEKEVTTDIESTHLKMCDLRSIERAWDLYVEENHPTLLTMKAYRDHHNIQHPNTGFKSKDRPNERKETFYLRRKEYMMDTKRSKKRKSRMERDKSRGGSVSSSENEGQPRSGREAPATPDTRRQVAATAINSIIVDQSPNLPLPSVTKGKRPVVQIPATQSSKTHPKDTEDEGEDNDDGSTYEEEYE